MTRPNRWLIFKSVRGMARPWLVFSPADRRTAAEVVWEHGHATWQEAIAYAMERWSK